MKEVGKASVSAGRPGSDIRAEVFVADLVERGASYSDFIVYPEGTFRRRYRKDIVSAEPLELAGGQAVTAVRVNRDGIYDALPEALFHDLPSESVRGIGEMAGNSKLQKQKEKETRNFFLPLENEIFLQKVILELTERRIIQRLSENLFQEIFPSFWNIDRSLPREQVSKLMMFLQHANRFAGNLELTAHALSLILNEKVTLNRYESGEHYRPGEMRLSQQSPALGEARLGFDFVCGRGAPDDLPVVEFVIGPLEHTAIADFLEKGKISRFVTLFFSYFIPVEMHAVMKVAGEASKSEFVLDGKTPSYLGYNTILKAS